MRVAAIRKARKLSQTDLAEMAGVTQPTIARLENGHDGVTLRLIKDVAAALGVPVAELFLDERTAREMSLLRVYRSLPEDRRQGWDDLATRLLGEMQARPPQSA